MNDVAQIERSPLDVVEDAPGGAHDQVEPACQRTHLPLDRLAAEDAADCDGGPHRQLLELGDDLLRELASRRQDNRLRTARSRLKHLD